MNLRSSPFCLQFGIQTLILWVEPGPLHRFPILTSHLIDTSQVLEATSTIRDNLISRQEPVWCLKTLHGCLLNYLAEHVPQEHFTDPRALAHVRAGSHAFGIIGLGKLIMRLPPEIVEEELPLLKRTLTTVCSADEPMCLSCPIIAISIHSRS
jgi:hypothetical protein